MTRFATFRVVGGRIAAPVSPMRFDDSIYRMLGENLVELTAERELLLDASTYGERSTFERASSRRAAQRLEVYALGLPRREQALLDDRVDAPVAVDHLGHAEIDGDRHQRDRLVLGQASAWS